MIGEWSGKPVLISGYASVFDETDGFNDVVLRGAFKDSLSRRSLDRVRMLIQHDPRRIVGHWTTVKEDDRGLYVEGWLMDGKYADLGGLSIGYRTIKSLKEAGKRMLSSVELWEISLTRTPALASAVILETKSANGG